jgi:hypothetical protein
VEFDLDKKMERKGKPEAAKTELLHDHIDLLSRHTVDAHQPLFAALHIKP